MRAFLPVRTGQKRAPPTRKAVRTSEKTGIEGAPAHFVLVGFPPTRPATLPSGSLLPGILFRGPQSRRRFIDGNRTRGAQARPRIRNHLRLEARRRRRLRRQGG